MTSAPRAEAMIDARRRDSATKRARVLATLERMLAEGTPITVVSAARAARVSTWLVYAPGMREAVTEHRARQHPHDTAGQQPDPATRGLRTDLALARAEITRLRAERDQHHQQLRLALGARLDNLAKADLITRLDELTAANLELTTAAAQLRTDNDALNARISDLEGDLAAARTSLRTMIRGENTPQPA